MCKLYRVFAVLLLTIGMVSAGHASARPERVVALEYSFVDALVAVGVSPVGVADDNRPERIIKAVRDRMGSYRSVGLRGQPSLEIIAALKPDLIIADRRRHQAIRDDLEALAPTLFLGSLGANYATILEDARVIGQAVGRSDSMDVRLTQHHERMHGYAQQLQLNGQQRFLFAVASSRGLTLHGPDSFAAGVLKRLGLAYALPDTVEQAYVKAGIEQLAAANPDWLLLATYTNTTGGDQLLKRWQRNPIWPYLTAVQQSQVTEVAPELWSLNRGLVTAETMAQTLLELGRSERNPS